MRILIIDDSDEIRNGLKNALEHEMFSVDEAADGERGSYLARTNEYDAIILDMILPKKSGARICQEIRETGKTTPIMMVSIRSAIEDKITLLNLGADDYVSKPFSYKELIARLRALLRRPYVIQSAIFKIDNLILDATNQSVSRANRKIYMTRKEFCLLEYLMRHKGSVVSRGMIMEHVWNADGDPFSNTIEAHILNVRKKIDGSQHTRKLIHTIPGRGYKIDTKK